MTVTDISGLAGIAHRYDSFFLDQYGVLHNGKVLYPGVVETLTKLKAAGRQIVLLSNSGQSGAFNARRLAAIGVPETLYDLFITSGDTALALAQEKRFAAAPGTRCFIIDSGSGHPGFCDALGLLPEADPARAELLLIAGSRGGTMTEADYAAILAPLAERAVNAVCTNPDKHMLTAGGTAFGAGRIAEIYQDLGGKVLWIGKPYPAMYDYAARRADVRPDRVLCVGDSIEHDIAGARNFGADSALVRTGILDTITDGERAGLYERYGVRPDFVLPGLIW